MSHHAARSPHLACSLLLLLVCVPALASAACTPCSATCKCANAGRYCANTPTAMCYPCAAGSFAAVNNYATCTPCPTGMWSAPGSSECAQCPSANAGAGWTVGVDSSVCKECPPGTINPGPFASSTCVACGSGKYNKFSGGTNLDHCLPCNGRDVGPGSAECPMADQDHQFSLPWWGWLVVAGGVGALIVAWFKLAPAGMADRVESKWVTFRDQFWVLVLLVYQGMAINSAISLLVLTLAHAGTVFRQCNLLSDSAEVCGLLQYCRWQGDAPTDVCSDSAWIAPTCLCTPEPWMHTPNLIFNIILSVSGSWWFFCAVVIVLNFLGCRSSFVARLVPEGNWRAFARRNPFAILAFIRHPGQLELVLKGGVVATHDLSRLDFLFNVTFEWLMLYASVQFYWAVNQYPELSSLNSSLIWFMASTVLPGVFSYCSSYFEWIKTKHRQKEEKKAAEAAAAANAANPPASPSGTGVQLTAVKVDVE